MQDAPATPAPFASAQWSGFGCAAVGCISYALFAIAQVIVFFIVLFHVHPDAAKVFTPSGAQTLTRWTVEISTAPNLFLFAIVGDGIMIAIAYVLARAFLNADARQLGLASRIDGQLLITGTLAGLGLVIVSQLVSLLQVKLFGSHPEAVAELLKTHHGTTNFFLDFASVCVIAPFAEELLFRGVIFAGLAQRLPVGIAAVLSGVIFGAAHLDPWSIAPLAVIGVGLALLYYRTGSLWPNIVAHATVNTVALVAVYFLPKLAT